MEESGSLPDPASFDSRLDKTCQVDSSKLDLPRRLGRSAKLCEVEDVIDRLDERIATSLYRLEERLLVRIEVGITKQFCGSEDPVKRCSQFV
jgi:hypothetical protein